ncbi:hypothetical protein STCU_12140 [Strigomonas culicis]|uniref:Cilia- and flagella-associated protein 300 n=1 Tax=Strigomonas culicis TaxID=28005 RepID=S9TBB3_9TRYP|nr:hypothetical protein STCU_12140 [Strigomonas culicis]|eukprot:EPY15302.1 hypothetical protein STCU_12140 [Strigomonas culicis]
MFGLQLYGGGGRGIAKKELRRLYRPAERKEFLYHLLWRCVAGGGAMNQFEDDFVVYKDACRWLYKQCIDASSLVVAERPDSTAATAGAEQVGYDVQQIRASVYSLTGLLPAHAASAATIPGQRAEALFPLFPNTRDELSDHLNYCYVVVNPLVEEVLVWYHCS